MANLDIERQTAKCLDKNERIKLYDDEMEITLSEKNTSMETPLFIDENGKLSVIVDISSIAGAPSYFEIQEVK